MMRGDQFDHGVFQTVLVMIVRLFVQHALRFHAILWLFTRQGRWTKAYTAIR